MTQCPWSIRWTFGQDARCTKPMGHVTRLDIQQLPDGRLAVDAEGDQEHAGAGLMPGQSIVWLAGDRREFEGEYPGRCAKLPNNACTLHTGHHGRCAP